MTDRAEVRNAADREQVKRAVRKERDRQELRRGILAAVMGQPHGRAFVWMLLADAGVFTSPFNPSGSTVYYNIGRSDFGRELLAELARDHAQAYLLMEQEARAEEAREDRERDAVHQGRRQQEE